MECDSLFEKSSPKFLREGSFPAISPPPLRFNLVQPEMLWWLGKSTITKEGRRESGRMRKHAGCVQCLIRRRRCQPDPRNPNGICLTCSWIQKGAPVPSLQHISPEANLTDAILTWTANDPSTDILILARSDNSLRQYIVDSSTDYIKTFMQSKDSITRGVFSLACGNGSWDKSRLIRATLQLWTITRLCEKKCSTHFAAQESQKTVLGSGKVIDLPHKTSRLDILSRQTVNLMKQSTFELQDLHFANRKQNWLTLFTTSYILLHNLELIIKRERDIAHASHSEFFYTNMEIITGCLQSAVTVLAYFHHSCRGPDLFSETAEAKEAYQRASLSTREEAFMEFLVAELRKRRDDLVTVSLTHEYDQKFWLTGQLFDRNWKPRKTLDHALPQTLQ